MAAEILLLLLGFLSHSLELCWQSGHQCFFKDPITTGVGLQMLLVGVRGFGGSTDDRPLSLLGNVKNPPQIFRSGSFSSGQSVFVGQRVLSLIAFSGSYF